ncbi:MAG TPA: phosphotransferase [Lentisphaeria bacterium]|nr:phosphotransferase [Lentisphaeria bacterium]
MYLHIKPEWRDTLQKNRLGSMESLLQYYGGTCLSSHSRSAIWRHTLHDGRTVFIKRNFFTKMTIILRYLLRGRKPVCNTEKERRAFALAAQHGFTVPEVIAWGEQRRFGLPHAGVMIMLPVAGVPVDRFAANPENQDKAREAIAQAERTLALLQDCRLDWKTDCKPEHFFVRPDGSIALIDLERLRLSKQPLTRDYRAMQLQRFRSLLPEPYRSQPTP